MLLVWQCFLTAGVAVLSHCAGEVPHLCTAAHALAVVIAHCAGWVPGSAVVHAVWWFPAEPQQDAWVDWLDG